MLVDQKEICEIFAETLFLEPSEVSMNSKLIDDLGAESIDFLDLTFQLESKYEIKIPRGSILSLAKNGLSDEDFAINKRVTPLGADRLNSSVLGLASDKIEVGMSIEEIPKTFTVNTFAKLVEVHLEEKLGTTNAKSSVAVNQ